MQPSLLRLSFLGLAVAALLNAPLVSAEPKRPSANESSLEQTLRASHKIDALIETGYKKHNIQPNPLSSDETFVRRVYLDVIGRIPTYDEAIDFIDSKDSGKRSKLIDKLLDSEGYVSHNFNYWADLLRPQSRSIFIETQPYIDFIKISLRENKPYDQFVRELITAEGYPWENGATGYYFRDAGMPLDNMSNTVRVFLGTQLLCAQCHDHPYESWTQKQYFQLAAFTYGVKTYDLRNPLQKKLREMRKDKDVDQSVVNAAFSILGPLRNRVNETSHVLRLPVDYQYSDASPQDPVEPKTIFGEKVEVRSGDSRKELYARWMTFSENPRFTKVIANRLWKRVMGVGIIEPVDDITDDVEPTNPDLMQFLEETMLQSKFDIKQYYRILLNTQTYQRDVSRKEVAEGAPYHFPGPVLRRVSAEQLWDSLLTIAVSHLDDRKFLIPRDRRQGNGAEVAGKDLEEILKMAKVKARESKLKSEYMRSIADLQIELRVAYRAKEQEKVKQAREKMYAIRREIYGPAADDELIRQSKLLSERFRLARTETDPRWLGFPKDLVRASELPSPAPPGHFLRQFGQSDRETIANASSEASIPQALTLLNGPLFAHLENPNSLLQKQLADAEKRLDKLDVLYISILSRRPTKREQEILLPRIRRDGDQGVRDVIRALLNTRQFMFVQ